MIVEIERFLHPLFFYMKELFNIVDIYRLVRKRYKFIGLFVFICTTITIFYSLSLPDIYRAEAVLLLAKSKQPNFSLGVLATTFGAPGGGQTTADRLVALLNTRTMAERMVRRFDLMKIYFKDMWDSERNEWKVEDPSEMPSMESAVNNFRGNMEIEDDQLPGIIQVYMLSDDPKLATDLANGVIEELTKFINESELTLAKKKRLFIEKQLMKNERDLLLAGKEFTEFYQQKRISASLPQIDVNISVDDDSDSQMGQPLIAAEDAGIKQHLQSLEARRKKIDAKLAELKIVRGVPQQVYLEYMTLKRGILSELSALLHQQYEMARIDETREEISFQVIDEARVPEKKCKPKRRKIVIIAFFISFLLSVFCVFLKENMASIWKELKA